MGRKKGSGFTPGNPTGSRCTQFGELTPKEIRFCEEYVKDFNAAAAMRRCGFGEDGSSKQLGYAYLRKDNVKNYIQNLMNQMTEQCQTTVSDLMQFWTVVMLDVNESTPNRLKASDYLAKALGAYNIKVETQSAPTIVMDLGLPQPSPEPLAIEAGAEILIEDEDVEDDEYDSDDSSF